MVWKVCIFKNECCVVLFKVISSLENESVAIKMNEYVKSSAGFDSGSSDAPIELEPKEVKPEIHIISNVDATLHGKKI